MNTKENKKFLLTLSSVLLIITLFFVSLIIIDTNETKRLNEKTLVLNNKMKVSDIDKTKENALKEEISRLNKSLNTINNDYSSQKSELNEIIKQFCKCLTYKMEYHDANNKTVQEIKDSLLPYVTEDCIKNYVTKNYIIIDRPPYHIKREPVNYLYNMDNEENPNVLCRVKYTDRNGSGIEYTVFKFIYDEKYNSYKINYVDTVKE